MTRAKSSNSVDGLPGKESFSKDWHQKCHCHLLSLVHEKTHLEFRIIPHIHIYTSIFNIYIYISNINCLKSSCTKYFSNIPDVPHPPLHHKHSTSNRFITSISPLPASIWFGTGTLSNMLWPTIGVSACVSAPDGRCSP